MVVKDGAQTGDVVTLALKMTPENGFVPESLFDTQGTVSFVLNWGNYLPGLHQLVEGFQPGDSAENVSVDAGWGSRRDDLLFEVPRPKLARLMRKNHTEIKEGSSLILPGKIDVLVKKIREEDSIVVLDANHPLAGSSYSCSFTVLDVAPVLSSLFEYHNDSKRPKRFEVATFALGCFWGGELAFSRVPGVVGTRVGYTQGMTESPTYEEVCEGSSQHREAVMVVFDNNLVTYQELMSVAMERLDQTSSPLELYELFQTPTDSRQYKHGFYFHTPDQRREASELLENTGNRFGVELLQASRFYPAEEYHQHYLFKGGQSTKKGSKEVIRCYG